LKRCQQNFSETAVHQSRVETRRLLSLVELLGPLSSRNRVKKAKACLKGHLNIFDELRDTQVQLQATKRMSLTFSAARGFREHLQHSEDCLLRPTRRRVKEIKTKRLGRIIDSCRKELKPWRARSRRLAATELVWNSVQEAFARTNELREQIEPHDTATIHRTRVAFKRFRYMVETLADFLPWARPRRLQAMHDYQTLMGAIQDAEILLRNFDNFVRQQRPPREPAASFRNQLLCRREHAIATYLAATAKLLEFWSLAPSRAVGGAPAGKPRVTPPLVAEASSSAPRCQPGAFDAAESRLL
jgi:CHAD domain-containing protein